MNHTWHAAMVARGSARALRGAAMVLAAAAALSVAAASGDEPAPQRIEFVARWRVQDPQGSWLVIERPVSWDARRTAVVICDMWDDHYCVNSARRVAEMAPVMNRVVAEARRRGALIVHCPSGCMDVYRDTPQRRLAQQAPVVQTKVPLERWCYLDERREAPLPIDDSVPCDDAQPRERKRFYTRQHEALHIHEGDAITDSAEALYLFAQRNIKHVIVMGVHTNMCVLGRPFGIRQLVYQGFDVVLMRDMTDSMYNPQMRPFVPHVRGTELVIEHVEKYWCPSVASTALTGRREFRFAEDPRPRVVLVAGGGEYDANVSLPQLANRLRAQAGLDCEVLHGRSLPPRTAPADGGADANAPPQPPQSVYEIPGLDALETADLLVLFLRRRALPEDQLRHIRRYLAAGKPLVALRTASHGFEVANPPPGHATWNDFDREVLGCDYRGHGPGSKGTDVSIEPAQADHPILAGVQPAQWHSPGSLYSAAPLAEDAVVLLRGAVDGRSEPIAWTRQYGDSRVFYTSLGHRDDFAQPQFVRLLENAIDWALHRPRAQPAPR